jgi:RimJ/RimL family protein N-acetyltransferase
MASDTPTVDLRPIQEPDLEILERIDTDPALSEPFEWRGFATARRHRQRWETDGYLRPDDSLLVIALADGTFAEIVNWRAITPSGPQGCFEIGILLLPEHRGQGHGTTAQRLLTDYLFATTTVHRLEAITEVDNTAEQRALERAGFVREGMLRGRGFVRGQWRDGYMYARLRDDPVPDR